MTGTKKTLIAGSTSAIGTALAHRLAANGFDLVLLNRDSGKTRSQADNLRAAFPQIRIDQAMADFADMGPLQSAVADIASRHPAIDLAFYNAGVLLPAASYTRDGIEQHFAINTLAPFALMHWLRPVLAAAGTARFVVSGSGARQMARKLDVAALPRPKTFRKMSGPYAQSKQAIAAVAHALTPDFLADGISLHTVDLPPTRTAMAASDGMPGLLRLFRFLFASPDASAQRLLSAALDPLPERAVRNKAAKSLPDSATQTALLDLLESLVDIRPLQAPIARRA